MSSSSSTAPVSSQTSKKSSRAIIGVTIALVTCAVLFTALFILYIIRQYRRRMSRLGRRGDASAMDLEAAEMRSDYSSFDDDEKKGIPGTPSIISIPDTVYAPHSGPVPITHEQRMKEVDVFFGGAPLHRSQ